MGVSGGSDGQFPNKAICFQSCGGQPLQHHQKTEIHPLNHFRTCTKPPGTTCFLHPKHCAIELLSWVENKSQNMHQTTWDNLLLHPKH